MGEEDHLGFDEWNVELSRILSESGVPHTFVLRPGGHGEDYTRENAQHSLQVHGAVFGRQ